jgi:hypothetical protein
MANTFKTKTQQGTGTSLTQVASYACPANTATVIVGLTMANTTTAEINVDVTHYTGSVDTYLGKGIPIPAGSSVVPIGGEQKIVLEPGCSIRVKSNTAASLDTIMSIMEIT